MTRVYQKETWYSCFITEASCDLAYGYNPPKCKKCPDYQQWVKDGRPKLIREK